MFERSGASRDEVLEAFLGARSKAAAVVAPETAAFLAEAQAATAGTSAGSPHHVPAPVPAACPSAATSAATSTATSAVPLTATPAAACALAVARAAGSLPPPAAGGAHPAARVDPGLSLPVQRLLGALPAVVGQVPVELPGPQALADTAALLGAVEQLHAALLGRVADVDARKPHTLHGASSTGSWVAQQQTSLDRGQVALARRLSSFPTLDSAVRHGRLSVTGAERVGRALAALRRHVDRPDGRIDGQDGEQVVTGVIGHGVHDLICQHLGGLDDDDPRLPALRTRLTGSLDAPTSQLGRLEQAFVLLAEHLDPAALPDALGALVDACLPNALERRADDAHSNRGFGLRRNHDGSGWHITDGDLDLEIGELLHTALCAALANDPDNPTDTAGYTHLRAQGWRPGDPLPDTTQADNSGTGADGGGAGLEAAGTDGGHRGPRSRRQRQHDALKLTLRTLLDSGALGQRGKNAPHLNITVGLDTLHHVPGALPAVTAAGTRLPTSLTRRWFCDSAITRLVLSLGGKVLAASHTARTLTATERTAKHLETGGRCQAAGCPHGPGTRLIPHHATPWQHSKTTSLRDTVLLCETSHHDLHTGNHTPRLKDGRWLNQHGWTDGPAPP